MPENGGKVNAEIEKPSIVPNPNGDFAQTGKESEKQFSVLDTLRLFAHMQR